MRSARISDDPIRTAGRRRGRSMSRVSIGSRWLGLAVGSDARGNSTTPSRIDRIQPLLLYQQAGRAYDPRARTYEPYWRHYASPTTSPP